MFVICKLKKKNENAYEIGFGNIMILNKIKEKA